MSIGPRLGGGYSWLVGRESYGGGLAAGYRMIPALALELRGDGYVGGDGASGPDGYSIWLFSLGLVWNLSPYSVVQPYLAGGVDVLLEREGGVPDVLVAAGGHLALGLVVGLSHSIDALFEARAVLFAEQGELVAAGMVFTVGIDWYL